MKGKASKIILVILIILVMLSVFVAVTMIAMPVLKKKDVTIAKDQTDKIKHSYANEDTSSSDSQEITRNYEIKSEETWDVSKNQDGSVMAKWTLSDKTIRISGSGEMRNWRYNEENDWHGTGYSEVIRNAVIEEGVTSIGNYAFEKCSNLESIEIIGKVTGIGNSAFYGCTSLKNVEIPDSVTKIDSKAFFKCSSLERIKIPDSVTDIDINGDIFSLCSNLKEIKVDSNNKNYIDEEGVLYNKNKTKLICYPIGKEKIEFAIPNGVTYIGMYAFFMCKSLETISIPDSAIEIEFEAFQDCSNLKTINIPNSITTIDNNAFAGCSSLESIEISNSITNIESCVFLNCSSLKNVKIPTSVTSIEYWAFSGCNSLQSIVIPDTVVNIENGAIPNKTLIYAKANSAGHKYGEKNEQGYILEGEATDVTTEYMIKNEEVWDISKNQDGSVVAKWSWPERTLKISGDGEMKNWEYNEKKDWHGRTYEGLINEIIIEKEVTNIGDRAFEDCSNLLNIEIPDNVVNIGSHAFSGCSSLKTLKMPNGIKDINFGLFGECSSLVSVNIPETVEKIGKYAFSNCNNLESINIPDSVIQIGDGAFGGCSNLENIEIPSSVNSIEDFVLSGCSKLKDIKVNSDNKRYMAEDGVLYNKNKTELLCYSAGKTEKSFVIPSSVIRIAGYAFEGCSNLTSIEIPDSVISIKNGAFKECSSLLSIEIPSSVTSIDMYVFSGCSNLKNVKLSEGVVKIESYAFENCENLTSIEIPYSLTSLAYGTFENCTRLSAIIVPETVTNIDGKAIPSSTIIYTKVNSEAHKYAEDGKQGYIIDDIGPVVIIETNGSENSKKEHKTKITVSDDGTGVDEKKLKYQWTQNEETPTKESFAQNLKNEQTITKDTGDGNWYLWIYAEDKVGNVTITRSNAFNFDNTPPVTNVEYSTTQPTIENVIATIKSNEPIQEVDGWKLSEDKMSLIKEYENNTTANGEIIEIKDLAGNSTTVTVKILNIQRKFETDQYKKVNDYIVKIKPNTTYNELIKNIQTNQTYTVKEGSKVISGTDIIKTGQVLTTQIGEQYTLVVLGDLNGDGKISLVELARISKIGAGKIKDYKEIEKMAIDANADGSINILDMAAISKLAVE